MESRESEDFLSTLHSLLSTKKNEFISKNFSMVLVSDSVGCGGVDVC